MIKQSESASAWSAPIAWLEGKTKNSEILTLSSVRVDQGDESVARAVVVLDRRIGVRSVDVQRRHLHEVLEPHALSLELCSVVLLLAVGVVVVLGVLLDDDDAVSTEVLCVVVSNAVADDIVACFLDAPRRLLQELLDPRRRGLEFRLTAGNQLGEVLRAILQAGHHRVVGIGRRIEGSSLQLEVGSYHLALLRSNVVYRDRRVVEGDQLEDRRPHQGFRIVALFGCLEQLREVVHVGLDVGVLIRTPVGLNHGLHQARQEGKIRLQVHQIAMAAVALRLELVFLLFKVGDLCLELFDQLLLRVALLEQMLACFFELRAASDDALQRANNVEVG